MAGFKKTKEVLPAILVSGISFAVMQWFTANFLGPALPDVIAGMSSILCLVIFLKFWKPKNTWRFPKEPVPTIHFGKEIYNRPDNQGMVSIYFINLNDHCMGNCNL